ncbi:MAG: type II secretion system F family protein [Anaerolineaceae bacterium]
MELIAALAAALLVFVLVFTLVTPSRPTSMTTRLDRLERGDRSDRESQLATPFATRVTKPILGKVRRGAGSVLPTSVVSAIERRILVAGDPISLHAFLTVQLVFVGGALFLWFVALSSGPSGIQLVIALVGPPALMLLPLWWLRLRVLGRQKLLVKALPDAVDLIVTTVEAGLAIDAALAEVGRETDGPLGEELRLTVRETTLGRSRRDALERLIERTQVPELKTFVQSLIQAEQSGIPIGQVLRTQADQVRLKKRQRAEAQAQRAPVKMVVVLVTLVLPSMLLLVMGPAIMRMAEQL